MNGTKSSATYNPGDIVPFHIQPGIAVAAFLVSGAGTAIGLQLLHFQNHSRKWHYWVQLMACVCSMGLVAVWCSHFTGYRAIVMGHGENDLQLILSSGLVTASCIIPTVCVFLVIVLSGDRNQPRRRYYIMLGIGGIFTGLAIVGTHYIACIAVDNYDVTFRPAYIAGAIAIACFAGSTLLIAMFYSQEHWRTWWAWRIASAVIVAVGIVSVHLEAIAGTQYRLKYRSGTSKVPSVVTIVMTLLTVPICVLIAYAAEKRRKELANHDHRIVLACAKFDSNGHIMVTHDGLLPSQKFTVDRSKTPLGEELSISHPDFQWLYRLSHSWCSIVRLLPSMRRHLQVCTVDSLSQKTTSNTATTLEARTTCATDHSIIIREKYCVAAADLSQELSEDISKLGALYDFVIKIGMRKESQVTLLSRYIQCTISDRLAVKENSDTERDAEIHGKGILLLFVGQCDRESALQQESRGYLFVRVERIVDHLSKVLGTPAYYLSTHLSNARMQATSAYDTLPSGILLGCFALRAGVVSKSWDLLVEKSRCEQLPCIELQICHLGNIEEQVLEKLNGKTVSTCMALLQPMLDSGTDTESQFATKFLNGIQQLADTLSETFFGRAVFCSAQFQVPSRSRLTGDIVHSGLLAFHVIRDVHDSPANIAEGLTYTPLSFYRCKHITMNGEISSAALERQIHKEFAAILPGIDLPDEIPTEQSRRGSATTPTTPTLRYVKSWLGVGRPQFQRSVSGSRSLARSLSSDPGTRGDEEQQNLAPFGGILVNRDIEVRKETREAPEEISTSPASFGTSAWAEEAEREPQTWVDTLYGITVEHWQRVERPHLTW